MVATELRCVCTDTTFFMFLIEFSEFFLLTSMRSLYDSGARFLEFYLYILTEEFGINSFFEFASLFLVFSPRWGLFIDE